VKAGTNDTGFVLMLKEMMTSVEHKRKVLKGGSMLSLSLSLAKKGYLRNCDN